MDTQAKRNELKKAYSGKAWEKKVDEMNDSQVVAVYLRLRKQGKL